MVLDEQCLIRPIQSALQICAGSLTWVHEAITWKILKPHLNYGKRRMTSLESLPYMHYYKLKKQVSAILWTILWKYHTHTRNASIYSLIIYHTLSRIVAYLPSHLPLCASTAEWRTSLAGSLKYATLFPPTIIQMNTSGIASCGWQSVKRWFHNASKNYFPSIRDNYCGKKSLFSFIQHWKVRQICMVTVKNEKGGVDRIKQNISLMHHNRFYL